VAMIVVTGGLGFIGSHTVEFLLERGYSVLVVDNMSTGDRGNLEGGKGFPGPRFYMADVSDWRLLWEGFRGFPSGEIEGIVHLAAMTGLEEVAENPWAALRVNVLGTFNILELARRLDVERVVFASSAAVYGEPRDTPIGESHPLKPASLYGETKVMGERLLWRFMEDYGVKTVALRYFNVYGPRMRSRGYASVVYKFIASSLAGSRPVIYGDGMQTRDFVYVKDVARANMLALNSKYSGPVNIGSGTETAIIALYEKICSLTSRCATPVFREARPGDVRRSVASIELARRVLGWRPMVSLDEGLGETIEYYRGRVK